LRVEVAGAATNNVATGCVNRTKGAPLTRVEGYSAGPVTFRYAHEHVHRATAAAELTSEREAALYRLQVRAAQLLEGGTTPACQLTARQQDQRACLATAPSVCDYGAGSALW
jgi:hypothetical protein